MANNVILSAEEESRLLAPIDAHVAEIQKKIDGLRADGTEKIVYLRNHIGIVKEDKNYTKAERAKLVEEDKRQIEEAKRVEAQNKGKIDALIAEAKRYLDVHYDKDYYNRVVESCREEKALALAEYEKAVATIKEDYAKHSQSFRQAGIKG